MMWVTGCLRPARRHDAMKHAVIFDIDGTLLDSSEIDDRIYRESVSQVVNGAKLRPSLGDYDRVTDTGILLQILEDSGLPADRALIAAVKEHFFQRLEDHVAEAGPFPEMPGAQAVLSRLQNSASHCLAIATGGWRRSASVKLESAGFDIAEIPLATSDDAVDRTSIMAFALASIGEDVASVTYYGDGRWDQKACEILGWTFRAVGPVMNGISSYDNEFALKSTR